MIPWHRVTWYTKLLAVILLCIVVPLISFYIGMKYQQLQDIKNNPPFAVFPKASK